MATEKISQGAVTSLGSTGAVANQALPLWGFADATIDAIKVRENAVYRVMRADEPLGALRVHRPGYHDDIALQSEFDWMRALANAGIPVPRPICSARGAQFEIVREVTTGKSYQVDVLEWIDGRPLGDVGGEVADRALDVDGQYTSIGRTMALIHNHAEHWTPPETFRRHAWDLDGLVGEQPFWGRFWELRGLTDEQRSLMQRARACIAESLAKLGQGCSIYGLIHADLIPDNILVTGTTQRVIDFDDAGYGWHLFDIATSLYFLIGESIFKQAREALLRGYRSVRPLSDDALKKLPIFLAARGTTYLGWVHTRRDTAAAEELAPMLIELGCQVAKEMIEIT